MQQRGFTGKDKIIKFAGCYHGHSDCLLVSAGSGVMASGIPDSAGVPKGCTQDTMTATYNDAASVEALLKQEEGNVATVIVEAVGNKHGCGSSEARLKVGFVSFAMSTIVC